MHYTLSSITYLVDISNKSDCCHFKQIRMLDCLVNQVNRRCVADRQNKVVSPSRIALLVLLVLYFRSHNYLLHMRHISLATLQFV